MIGQLIKQANNSLTQRMNIFAKKYDLTGTQMSVIDYLGRCKNYECDQKEIETEFDIKRSSTTVLLQRLVKKNMIARRASDTDNRKKVIQLTEKGKRLIPYVADYIASDEKRLLKQYSEQEVQIIERFLKDVTKSRFQQLSSHD